MAAMKTLQQQPFNHCTILHYYKKNTNAGCSRVQQMGLHADNIYRKCPTSKGYEFATVRNSQKKTHPLLCYQSVTKE